MTSVNVDVFNVKISLQSRQRPFPLVNAQFEACIALTKTKNKEKNGECFVFSFVAKDYVFARQCHSLSMNIQRGTAPRSVLCGIMYKYVCLAHTHAHKI